jgi:hypothetical protein
MPPVLEPYKEIPLVPACQTCATPGLATAHAKGKLDYSRPELADFSCSLSSKEPQL